MTGGQRKFGLQLPSKPTKPVLSKPALFDEDDDKAVPKIDSSEMKKRQLKKIQQEALKEDPTLYLYDELVEVAPKQTKIAIESKTLTQSKDGKVAEKPKPKYMKALLQRAAERKVENEVIKVRLLQKEAAMDSDKYGDKEIFVTSTYKKKLEAMKEKMEETAAEDAQQANKKSDMTKFYSNLLKRNVAFGAGQGGRINSQAHGAVSDKTRLQENLEDEEEETFGPVRKK